MYDVVSIEDVLQLFMNNSRLQSLIHDHSYLLPTHLEIIKCMELVQTIVLSIILCIKFKNGQLLEICIFLTSLSQYYHKKNI